MAGVDLEDVASLVSQPHLEDARQAPEYSLWIEGSSTVDALCCWISVDMINSEESLGSDSELQRELDCLADLVDVAGDSSDTAGVVVSRRPVVEAARPSVAASAARAGHEVDDELVEEEEGGHDGPLWQEVEQVLHVAESPAVVGGAGPGEAVAHQEDHKVTNPEPLKDPGHSQSGQVDPTAQGVEDEPQQPELDRPHWGLPLDGRLHRHGDADPHDPDEPGEHQVACSMNQ